MEVEKQQVDFIPAQNKSMLTQNDDIIFVMAGRKELALIPGCVSQVRMVIVLTQTEHLTLEPSQTLCEKVDFLNVKPFVKPSDDSKTYPFSITSRRRAVLMFCFESGLDDNKILMLDDNINKCHLIKKETGDDALDLTQRIFNYFKNKMIECSEPLVFGQTFSNKQKSQSDNIFGGKFTMLNLSAIKKRFPTDENGNHITNAIFSLMPEHDLTSCQDYFLELFLHLTEEGNNKIGFKRLPPSEFQLVRSTIETHSARKTNNTAQVIHLSAPFKQYILDNSNADFLEKICQTVQIFNCKITQAKGIYDRQINFLENNDITDKLAKKYKLDTSPMTGSSSDTLSSLLNNALNHEDNFLYEHQKKAIHFYLENQMSQKQVYDIATGCGKTFIQAMIAFATLKMTPQKNVIIVCPTIQLVIQTRDKLREYSKHRFLHDALFVPSGKIHAVCSSHTDAIPHSAFHFNKLLQTSGHVLVVCKESFKRTIKRSQTPNPEMLENGMPSDDAELFTEQALYNFIKMGSVLLNDESHLVDKENISTMIQRQSNLTLQTLNFSATPIEPLASSSDSFTPTFTFTRRDGVEKKILSPLMIDNSLPINRSHEDIAV